MAHDLHVAMKEILGIVGAKKIKLAVGHSFGGSLVLAAAQREPELIEKILLCDPVVFSPMPPEENQARA